jgi:hypothetical protein
MALRFSQPKGEATEFAKRFEGIVKDINPAYERNRLIRGTRLEFLREIIPGVFSSHNVFCLRGRYRHGFCITLHKEQSTPYLISPLVIGGRFDHNNSAKMAYFRDIEPNKKWPFGAINFSDSHEYRRGWDGIAAKCASVAEERMLPHYLRELDKHRVAVLALLKKLVSMGEVQPAVERGNYPCYIYPFDYDLPRFAKRYNEPTTDRDKFLTELIQSKPELFNKLIQTGNFRTLISTLAK